MDENVDYTVSPSLPTAALAAPDVADEAAPGAGPALTAGATTVAPGPAPTLDPSPDRGPSLRPGAPDAASLSPLPGLAPGPSPAAGLRLRTEAPGPGLSPRAGLSLQGTTNPSLKPTGHCQISADCSFTEDFRTSLTQNWLQCFHRMQTERLLELGLKYFNELF